MGFDLIQLARFNEGCDARPVYGTLVVASKQCVLAIELDRTDLVLHRVGINLHAAVVQEHQQAIPLVGNVGQLLARRERAETRERCSSSHTPKVFTIGAERCHRAGLALVRRKTSDLLLDPEEPRDPLQSRRNRSFWDVARCGC